MTKSIFQTLPIIGAFFVPALYVGILVLLLMLIDTYFGIIKAMYLREKITTNRFSDYFAKLIGYSLFLTFGLLLDKITGWGYSVWVASIIPIFTEIKSIDENQKKMNQKGIIERAEEVYKFALNIKKKRDELR